MAVGNQPSNGEAVGPHIAPRTLAELGAAVNNVGVLTESADADGAGVATLTFTPGADQGTHVLVERVVVVSAGAAQARVYVNAVNASGLRDVTAAGAEDVADENQPIYAGPQQPIIVQFTGVATGVECTATIQYRIKSDGT